MMWMGPVAETFRRRSCCDSRAARRIRRPKLGLKLIFLATPRRSIGTICDYDSKSDTSGARELEKRFSYRERDVSLIVMLPMLVENDVSSLSISL